MADVIKGSGEKEGLIRRTKSVVNWNDHNAELIALRDKLRMSHLALQTILQTIVVSPSKQSYDSIHSVQIKLDKLKESIDNASRANMRPTRDISHNNSDLRFIHNLRKLLGAAKQFHTSASSTAGSILEGTTGPWVTNSSQAVTGSEVGDFPPSRRRWVEDYVRAGRQHGMFLPSSPHTADYTDLRDVPSQRVEPLPKAETFVETESIISHAALYTNPTITKDQGYEENKDAKNSDGYDDECDDAEAERGFQLRLQSLAKDMIRRQDYQNTIDFLHKALQSGVHTAAAQVERRQLQVQLALCHLLRGNWKQAEVSISCLSKVKRDRDAVVCTLLHALALAHLLRYSFDTALSIAQRALQGRKSLNLGGNIDVSEVDETRALLATIYKVREGKDDYIRADVFQEQLSKDFRYVHPRDEVAFIKDHPTLISTIIGSENLELERRPLKDPDSPPGVVPGWATGLPTHTLSLELGKHERYGQDTDKYVVPSPTSPDEPMTSLDMDLHPDSEASTIAVTPEEGAQNQWTSMINSESRTAAFNHEDCPLSEASPIRTSSHASRWLRLRNVIGLRKPGNFLRKRPAHKQEGNFTEDRRAHNLWFSRRTPKITTSGSGQEVRCDDTAGHRIIGWAGVQTRDIETSSLSSGAFYSHSEAGGAIVTRNEYQDDTSFEMDSTQAFDSVTNSGPGIENMPRSEMNDAQVSGVSNLGLAVHLSHNKSGQVRDLSSHSRLGYADHDVYITSAEPDTALLPSPWPMRWSNMPKSLSLPPIQVQSHPSGSEVSTALLKSTGGTVRTPWPTQRNTQPANYSAIPHTGLWRPQIPYGLGAFQHGCCPANVCLPDQIFPASQDVYLLPDQPAVSDSGDCLRPFPINAAAIMKHTEEGQANVPPWETNISAAEYAHESGYGTTITGRQDSVEESEKSSWVVQHANSLEHSNAPG